MKLIAIIFAIACLLLWYPVRVFEPILAVERVDPRPAGEITSTFVLAQEVNWGSSGFSNLDERNICVGVRFATFKRDNFGQFSLIIKQGRSEEEWEVKASSLDDNEFRYFCPDQNFKLKENFLIEIQGQNGVVGRSPTVWLTSDTRFGQVAIDGRVHRLGLDLLIARALRRSPLKLAQERHGAFVVSSICTLFTGLVALLWAARRKF